MHAINCYKDLVTEIEIAKTRIEGLEGQRKELMKLLGAPSELCAQQYSDMPKGNHNYMSIDRIVDTLHRIDNMLEIENGLLKGMFDTQASISDKLKGLEGTQYKIMYLKTIIGKSCTDIALELNYSERHVRRILAEAQQNMSQKCPKIRRIIVLRISGEHPL